MLDRARLDVPNQIESNGERMVQRTVLERADGETLTVVDVGAHFGEWSSHLIEQARERGVSLDLHLFEPARYTFAKLQESLPEVQGIETAVNRIALSSAPGTTDLHKPTEGAGSSSLHPFGSDATETVSLLTLEGYCAERQISRIALLKCDAEGHDLFVLEGANTLLRDRGIQVVQFEYNARWIYARRYLRDAFALLGSYGYELGKVTPLGIEFYPDWDAELETFREANFVAVAPESRGWFPAVRWWNAPAGHAED